MPLDVVKTSLNRVQTRSKPLFHTRLDAKNVSSELHLIYIWVSHSSASVMRRHQVYAIDLSNHWILEKHHFMYLRFCMTVSRKLEMRILYFSLSLTNFALNPACERSFRINEERRGYSTFF